MSDADPANKPAVPRSRGRPPGSGATRSDPAFMFACWRLVREEFAHRDARNVTAACAAILRRWPKLNITAPDGALLGRITAAGTLRQWYAAAEKARAVDQGLAARCEAWEAQARARWPARAASIAAQQAAAEVERRSSGMQPQRDLAAMNRAAEAAAHRAVRHVGAMSSPKKHRR